MRSATAAYRFRLGVVLVFMVSLALGSFWLLQVLRRSIEVTTTIQVRSEPDYTVEQFNFIRMSDAGRARYTVSGKKLFHYPLSDTFEIQQPVLHSLSDNQAPITMRSNRAMVNNANNLIELHNNVHVDRPKMGASEKFHLRSDFLRVLPDKDVMETDKAVDIRLGASTLQGVGMFANNATREFRLLNNVRGTFEKIPH